MRTIWILSFLGLTLGGCDQLQQLIPGAEPEAVVDTGGAAAEVGGVISVEAPPATAQIDDDKRVRDGDGLDKLTRITLELSTALERYLGWEEEADPFDDALSQHVVAPFQVEVVDLQLIHPWMPSYRARSSFSTTQGDVRRNDGRWGATVTLEVRNDTGRVLKAPDFELGLKINHGYQNTICAYNSKLDDDRSDKTASFQQQTERPWSKETTGQERFWRPGETVRRQLVSLCGDESIFDAGIGSGMVQVNIEADEYIGNLEHEMVGAVQQEFGANAFTLRTVALDKNRVGYAFGSGVITFIKGRVHRSQLADHGLRADAQDVFTGLPGVMAQVVANMNELQVTLDSVELKHWPDVANQKAAKGSRRVFVKLKQSIDSEATLQRLSSAIAEAKSARVEARQSRTASEATLARVRATGDRNAISEASRALSNAQRNFDSAKRMVKVAKNSYETGATRAREQMSRALSCDRIRLVTATREISVNNGERVRADCDVLRKKDNAATTLRYSIGRYEVPIGLTFALGNKAYIGWVANQVTTSFDAR